MYHTHPNNTPLSPDDPYQGVISTYAVGWDGISRGALFWDKDNGYSLTEIVVTGRR